MLYVFESCKIIVEQLQEPLLGLATRLPSGIRTGCPNSHPERLGNLMQWLAPLKLFLCFAADKNRVNGTWQHISSSSQSTSSIRIRLFKSCCRFAGQLRKSLANTN